MSGLGEMLNIPIIFRSETSREWFYSNKFDLIDIRHRQELPLLNPGLLPAQICRHCFRVKIYPVPSTGFQRMKKWREKWVSRRRLYCILLRLPYEFDNPKCGCS